MTWEKKKKSTKPCFLNVFLLYTLLASITAVSKPLPLSLQCCRILSTVDRGEEISSALFSRWRAKGWTRMFTHWKCNLASWYLQPPRVVTGERNASLESDYRQESNFYSWSCKLDASVFFHGLQKQPGNTRPNEVPVAVCPLEMEGEMKIFLQSKELMLSPPHWGLRSVSRLCVTSEMTWCLSAPGSAVPLREVESWAVLFSWTILRSDFITHETDDILFLQWSADWSGWQLFSPGV